MPGALLALLLWSRPHTVVATVVQVLCLYVIAGGALLPDWTGLGVLVLTVGTCLGLNAWVVGINQLSDVAIDRINKPWLPLASGVFGVHQARLLVGGSALVALVGGILAGPTLLTTVVAIMCIGGAYSLPPLRLKRFAIGAALCIALARGGLANLGILAHFDDSLAGLDALPSATLVALVVFFFSFCLVIALFKDIPDRLGDEAFGIRTFTVLLGPRTVFQLGRAMLGILYVLVILIAVRNLSGTGASLVLMAQAAAALCFWAVTARADLNNQAYVVRVYQVLWGLFYTQYVVFAMWRFAAGSA